MLIRTKGLNPVRRLDLNLSPLNTQVALPAGSDAFHGNLYTKF